MPKFHKEKIGDEILNKVSTTQSTVFLSFIAILLIFRVALLRLVKEKLDTFYRCIIDQYKLSQEDTNLLFEDEETIEEDKPSYR